MIVYENQIDVEDLDSMFGGFLGLVQTQGWEIGFMPSPEKKIALLQVREFYHTLVKVNEENY